MAFFFRDKGYINTDRSNILNYFLNQTDLISFKDVCWEEKRQIKEVLVCIPPGMHRRQLSPAQTRLDASTEGLWSPTSSSWPQVHRGARDLTLLKRRKLRTCFQGSRGHEHIKYKYHLRCHSIPAAASSSRQACDAYLVSTKLPA